MNTTVETLGLNILSTHPQAFSALVGVDSAVTLEFNREINPKTATGIYLFKDNGKMYKDNSSLSSKSNFVNVAIDVSCDKNIITIKPKMTLDFESQYVVAVTNIVKSVTSDHMAKEFTFCFSTITRSLYVETCEIIYPRYGDVIESLEYIEWIADNSLIHVIQIGKTPDFENLVYNETARNRFADVNKFPVNNKFPEGLYYVRAKCLNGEWSQPVQFFLKDEMDGIVSEQDIREEILLYDTHDIAPQILEQFPEPNSVQNTLKTNVIYVKIKGIYDFSNVDLRSSYIISKPLDLDEITDDEPEELDGEWIIIQDKEAGCTYVIFNIKHPDLPDPAPEEEGE